MLDFPRSTYIHRRLPKEAFYQNLSLTAALQEKFVTDVERIYVENSLTTQSLNLDQTSDIKEILILAVSLKKQEFDGKIIEAIARQNPHKLVFVLRYGEAQQLAVYQGKLYRSRWQQADTTALQADGFSLDEIWTRFVEQIALAEERAAAATERPLAERLALQEQIVKLEKQIAKTEKAAWAEQQPKKRFALYTKLQTEKKKLEALKNGET